MRAMLAKNWSPEFSITDFIDNPRYVFEQKFDGHRILIEIDNNNITAYNREGTISQHNDMFQQEQWIFNFSQLYGRDFILDGELVGDTLFLFDMPYAENMIEMEMPQERRKYALDSMFSISKFNHHLNLVYTAFDAETKKELLVSCHNSGAEGIIIKDSQGAYVQGPSTNMMKLKFTKSADLFVTRTNVDGKTNAILSAYDDDGNEVEVGKCSLIGKEHICTGDVVEVRYLYASDRLRLVQPRIKFKREDKSPQQCMLSQITPSNTKTAVPI